MCAEAEYGHTFQRLKGAFRIASPLIKPINSKCAAVFGSRSSSRAWVSVRRLSPTSVRISCRRLSFGSEERPLHCSAGDNFRKFLASSHNLLACSACFGISAIKGFQLRHELALLRLFVKP